MLLAKSNNIIVRRNSNNGACKNLSFFRSHNAHMFHPPFRLYPRYYSTAQHKNQVGNSYFFDFFGTRQRQQKQQVLSRLKTSPSRQCRATSPKRRSIDSSTASVPPSLQGKATKRLPCQGSWIFALAKRLRGYFNQPKSFAKRSLNH